MILLGERPGLGTGDGLSAYVVYDPQGRQDRRRSQHDLATSTRAASPPEEAGAAARGARGGDDRAATQRRDARSRRDSATRRGRGYRAPQVRQKLVERDDPRADRSRRCSRCAACRSADPALVAAYGGDPARHTALGLVTVRSGRRDVRRARRGDQARAGRRDLREELLRRRRARERPAVGRDPRRARGDRARGDRERRSTRCCAASRTTRASTTPTASARSPCSRT